MRRRQRGAALLEFAAALPFSLLLFLGISDFSMYFWRQTQMEDAARLTVAKITPAITSFDAGTLHEYSQSLQNEMRVASGMNTMLIALTRDYACPTATGSELPATPFPAHCKDERIYLRVASDVPVEPMLAPLRALGFPKTAFSRHGIRLQ